MIVCVRIPRFELLVAIGGRQALVSGRALALAPPPSGEQLVGEVSGAAEAFGVQPGMALGEALARCPSLELLASDPIGVAAAQEQLASALEGIGAAVELGERPGAAYFDASGLRSIWPSRGRRGGYEGGAAGLRPASLAPHSSYEGVLGATQRTLSAVRGVGASARLGGAPSRFCALAAALQARAQRPSLVTGAAREYLASREIALLAERPRTEQLVRPLTRLGILTLGELAALPRDAVADRLGKNGLYARWLARGRDTPPSPRSPSQRLHVSLELEEAASGPALERALGVLIDRLLAHPDRRARPLRAAVLAARLVEGGTWRERVVFRGPIADPLRMRLALAGRLAQLPAPAATLGLAADELGTAGGMTEPLLHDSAAARRTRLREAVDQARVAGGPDAALRAVPIDPDSRVPERRVMLTPYEGEP
jgi:protein ImuB